MFRAITCAPNLLWFPHTPNPLPPSDPFHYITITTGLAIYPPPPHHQPLPLPMCTDIKYPSILSLFYNTCRATSPLPKNFNCPCIDLLILCRYTLFSSPFFQFYHYMIITLQKKLDLGKGRNVRKWWPVLWSAPKTKLSFGMWLENVVFWLLIKELVCICSRNVKSKRPQVVGSERERDLVHLVWSID